MYFSFHYLSWKSIEIEVYSTRIYVFLTNIFHVSGVKFSSLEVVTPIWRALRTYLVVSGSVTKDLCGSWIQKLSLGTEVDNTVFPKC